MDSLDEKYIDDLELDFDGEVNFGDDGDSYPEAEPVAIPQESFPDEAPLPQDELEIDETDQITQDDSVAVTETKKTASFPTPKKRGRRPKQAPRPDDELDASDILRNPVAAPIWLSISEAAKLAGINTKTLRRAIQAEKIKYKIYRDRYFIGLRSLVRYMHSSTKLKNKFIYSGLGQYVENWR